jgi:hypothetical protein
MNISALFYVPLCSAVFHFSGTEQRNNLPLLRFRKLLYTKLPLTGVSVL